MNYPKILSKPHIRQFSDSIKLFKKFVPEDLKSKPKSVSSVHWLSRQLSDPYVEKAKRMNYRCRSAFKLIEIDDRFRILHPGQNVVDCGAAPGSWTQIAVKRVNSDGESKNLPKGKVIAIDKQQIYPVNGATIFGNMDFTDLDTQNKINEYLNGETIQVVLSDMAPKATGVTDLDNENIIKLCYSALRFAIKTSEKGACLVVKLWQCGDSKTLENDMLKFYGNVKTVKPNSSRSDSTEIFLLGRDFKGLKNK